MSVPATHARMVASVMTESMDTDVPVLLDILVHTVRQVHLEGFTAISFQDTSTKYCTMNKLQHIHY